MAIERLKNCKMCGQPFISRSTNGKYCSNCRKKAKKLYNKVYNGVYLKKRKKSYYKPSGKTLREITRELEEYNREHKTRLTYGQYVLKVEGGQTNGNK